MNPATQVLLSMSVPTLVVMLGFLYNNSRITDLRSHIDTRFELMQKYLDARFDATDARFNEARAELRRVEEVLDARLKHLEERAR